MRAFVLFINSRFMTREIAATAFEAIKKKLNTSIAVPCIPRAVSGDRQSITDALLESSGEDTLVLFVGAEAIGYPELYEIMTGAIKASLADFTVFKTPAGETTGYGFTHRGCLVAALPCNTQALARILAGSAGDYLSKEPVAQSGHKAAADTVSRGRETVRIPKRKKSPRSKRTDIILSLLLAFLICTSSFCGYHIVRIWSDRVTSKDDYAQLAAQADTGLPPDESGEDGISYMNFDLEALKQQNSDLIGYIKLDGTVIDYPVTQTDNNSYYLKHSFLRKKSDYGCIFLDSGALLTDGETSRNLVLYGHHMNNGTMFAALNSYKDLNFYRSAPLIYFNTLHEKGVWKVFAVYVTNTKASDDNGTVFNYMQSDFEDDEAFMGFVKQIKRRSVLNIPVEINPGDRLLTLSTCDYSFNDARLIVVAKLVTSAEDADVELSRVRTNPAPLYPAAWYAKHGGEKPSEDKMQVYADFFE